VGANRNATARRGVGGSPGVGASWSGRVTTCGSR